jgi:hypothetical protein
LSLLLLFTRISLPLLLLAALSPCATVHFTIVTPAGAGGRPPDPGISAYARVLDSVELPYVQLPADSLDKVPQSSALIIPASVARGLQPVMVERIVALVRKGALLITEEETQLARSLGVSFSGDKVPVLQVEDILYPRLMIVWEKPVEVSRIAVTDKARLLAKEKWSGAPLMVTFPEGRGRVLYLAAELDPLHGEGYARFPYLVHALVKECGVRLPFRSPRLHAFFDYGFRSTVDLEYFARRWRRSGVLALHVSAWQFWDRNRDDYLKDLISACHKNGILIYAWFELPHVSQDFWQKHPEWREKTATLADAKLDWRALVNLLQPAAFKSVADGLLRLLGDFDWDGINLSELYFESPLGPANEHRFTPMNDLVRAEFRSQAGFDPIELFRKDSPRHWQKDPTSWQKFVDYRVKLVARLHEQVLTVVQEARRSKPYLDLTVTFVDNLYDGRMREAIGTDVNVILPLAPRFDFTLIMEDPGTIWSHGPARYRMLGERYREIAPQTRWGIDINVVDRYQEVFPTKKQTGTEFLQLFHFAGQYFPLVLVYFEQSVYPQDMEMVAHALASDARLVEEQAGRFAVESARPVVFDAGGARVLVDGKLWPVRDDDRVALPAGKHAVQVETGAPPSFRLLKLTGDLVDAGYDGPRGIRFRYQSRARAIAVFSSRPSSIMLDDAPYAESMQEFYGEFSVMLPPGGHEVKTLF